MSYLKPAIDKQIIDILLSTFQKCMEPVKRISLGRSQKIVFISLGSIAALGIIARYLRRKRYIPVFKKGSSKEFKSRISANEDGASQASTRRSGSPSVRSLHRQASFLSDRLSTASSSLPGLAPGDVTLLSPQQLGVMGLILVRHRNLKLTDPLQTNQDTLISSVVAWQADHDSIQTPETDMSAEPIGIAQIIQTLFVLVAGLHYY